MCNYCAMICSLFMLCLFGGNASVTDSELFEGLPSSLQNQLQLTITDEMGFFESLNFEGMSSLEGEMQLVMQHGLSLNMVLWERTFVSYQRRSVFVHVCVLFVLFHMHNYKMVM